jgi:hypothetical protein
MGNENHQKRNGILQLAQAYYYFLRLLIWLRKAN